VFGLCSVAPTDSSMQHVLLQATLQQVLTQQWELQQQVDVNASHLEKERYQLAEQIKKVL